jgi:cytochrome c oxidase cbb3-type subunit III
VITSNIKSDSGWRTRRFHCRGLLPVGAWLLISAGCDLPGQPRPGDQATAPENVLKFTTLFAEHCAGCHGARGEFGPAPPLNVPLFRGIVSEAELERVIQEGRKDTPMPAFARDYGGVLSREQIQVLVHEIKGTGYQIVNDSESGTATVEAVSSVSSAEAISPSWAVSNSPPAGVPAYSLAEAMPRRTSEEIDAIRKTTFSRACGGCHGNNGQGTSKAGAINDVALLTLMSNQFLRRLVITGRADLGMPEFAGTSGRPADFRPLTSDEIAELVELLDYWRQGSASLGSVNEPRRVNSVRGPTEKVGQSEESF